MKKELAKIQALLKKGQPFQERYGKGALRVFIDDGAVFLLLSKAGDWAGREHGTDMVRMDGIIGGYSTRALTVVRYFWKAGLITEGEYEVFGGWWSAQENTMRRESDLSRANELAHVHGHKVVPV